jgi:hypothetical protein
MAGDVFWVVVVETTVKENYAVLSQGPARLGYKARRAF